MWYTVLAPGIAYRRNGARALDRPCYEGGTVRCFNTWEQGGWGRPCFFDYVLGNLFATVIYWVNALLIPYYSKPDIRFTGIGILTITICISKLIAFWVGFNMASIVAATDNPTSTCTIGYQRVSLGSTCI